MTLAWLSYTITNMAREPISKIAQDVYTFVLTYRDDNGYMPTLGEIAANFTRNGDTYSKEWARLCLKELEKQGKIKVEPRKHRGILLT